MARPLIPYKKQYTTLKRRSDQGFSPIDLYNEFQRVEKGIPSFGCINISRDYQIETQDYIVSADPSGKSLIVTLPPPQDSLSHELLIIKATDTPNTVTVLGVIDGAEGSRSISPQFGSLRLVSIGSTWVLV